MESGVFFLDCVAMLCSVPCREWDGSWLNFIINLEQPRVTWKEVTLMDEFHRSDWSVTMYVTDHFGFD